MAFWMFTPWLPSRINAGQLIGRCEFLNGAEMVRERLVNGEFYRSGLPTAQIEFTDEDYDQDCFEWKGFTFVSEKMRRATALGPSEIQYLDVDSSRSAPLPRSKLYQIMHVPVTEDVSNPERSATGFDTVRKASSCGALLFWSPSVRMPRQRMSSSTIGFSRSLFAPTRLHRAFCTPDVQECAS